MSAGLTSSHGEHPEDAGDHGLKHGIRIDGLCRMQKRNCSGKTSKCTAYKYTIKGNKCQDKYILFYTKI
jgi:hypothetical protein